MTSLDDFALWRHRYHGASSSSKYLNPATNTACARLSSFVSKTVQYGSLEDSLRPHGFQRWRHAEGPTPPHLSRIQTHLLLALVMASQHHRQVDTASKICSNEKLPIQTPCVRCCVRARTHTMCGWESLCTLRASCSHLTSSACSPRTKPHTLTHARMVAP
jgi:hypothetical protein